MYLYVVIKSLIGRKFGHLKVIGFATNRKLHPRWLCLCDCQRKIIAFDTNLKRGLSTRCTKCRNVVVGNARRTHGRAHKPNRKADKAYSAWSKMKDRCLNTGGYDYYLYGAIGVTVCDRWKNSFEDFLKDVGDPPSPNHSLDRHPNLNGNYEPGNVRWATVKEQANNKRNNRKVSFRGKPIAMSLASELTGITYVKISDLSRRFNATVEQILEFTRNKKYRNQGFREFFPV